MTELKLTQLPNGQIAAEIEGSHDDIAKMICGAMIGSVDIAAMVCGAIPSFLDKKGIDRAGFCKTIMDAVGDKKI